MARVLVADDNAANRDLVVTLLGYRGHTVVAAADGREALEAAQADPPDLIITDLVMPVMDGYELVREIRADQALDAIPAIFYTANYLESEVRPMATALGVRYLLAKPVDPPTLLRTVEEALSEGSSSVAVPTAEFHREHQRAVSAKLADKVTELEHARAALSASEARFRALAEHSPMGIFSLNVEGVLTYANPRLLQICGNARSPEEVYWLGLAHPDDREALKSEVSTLLRDRVQFEQTLRLVPAGSPMRWITIQVAPVVDGPNETTFVGTVQDITAAVDAQQARHEIEERLRLSERLESLGELAAGIAHDFNNALSVIMSYNEFLTDDLATVAIDEAARARLIENSAAVRLAADRAAGLTHRLLVFARRGVTQPEPVDLNEASRDALGLLARTIGAHVQLVDRLSTARYVVMADRTQLEQVIVNLVVNARDAIGLRGQIVVATDRVKIDRAAAARYVGIAPGWYAELTVSDNGSGIPPDVISRVFEPFFTTKPQGEGTGLGLATVYGIATSLSGTVTITSVPSEGTRVTVLLPLATAPTAALTTSPPSRARGS